MDLESLTYEEITMGRFHKDKFFLVEDVYMYDEKVHENIKNLENRIVQLQEFIDKFLNKAIDLKVELYKDYDKLWK